MRESFVIHSEYIEDLPDELKSTFLMYIYNYGINSIEPPLSGLEKTVWIKIKRRIDADIEAFEQTKNARSEAGKKHTGNQYSKKTDTNADSKMEQNGTNGTHFHSSGTKWNNVEQNGTNGTVFVSDNVSVFDNESVSVSEGESVDNLPPPLPVDNSTENSQNTTLVPVTTPSLTSENQTEYAKEIFTKFQVAGLPCWNGNFLSFLQQDFKNTIPIRHGIHSSDVLQAVDNYISELKDTDSYITQQYSFEAFCRSRHFTSFLPANYRHENFVKFGVKQKPQEIPPSPEVIKMRELKKEHPEKCEICSTPLVDSCGNGWTWFCPQCRHEYKVVQGKWRLVRESELYESG